MIHVITPFSRPQNILALVEHLRPAGIIWHPLHHGLVDFPKEPWIQPRQIGYPNEWLATGACCYWKVNQFIDDGLEDGDYYGVLCDDDMYALGFWDKFRTHSGDIIVASLEHTSLNTLVAAPENMKQGRVSFEQMFAKAHIWNEFRYNNDCQADGNLIERVHQRYADKFDYAPECFVMFNLLR